MIILEDGDICPVCGEGILKDVLGDGTILVCEDCGARFEEQ
jgi:hypothetical protein